jgi:hypothetical protein
VALGSLSQFFSIQEGVKSLHNLLTLWVREFFNLAKHSPQARITASAHPLFEN